MYFCATGMTIACRGDNQKGLKLSAKGESKKGERRKEQEPTQEGGDGVCWCVHLSLRIGVTLTQKNGQNSVQDSRMHACMGGSRAPPYLDKLNFSAPPLHVRGALVVFYYGTPRS